MGRGVRTSFSSPRDPLVILVFRASKNEHSAFDVEDAERSGEEGKITNMEYM